MAPPQRIVYGVRPVEEALRAKRVQALFIAEGLEDERGGPGKAVLEAAKQASLQPVTRPRAVLDELAHGGVHQGVLAVTGD